MGCFLRGREGPLNCFLYEDGVGHFGIKFCILESIFLSFFSLSENPIIIIITDNF